MSKYTIGVDFGTLSGRAMIVDVTTGAELADSVFDYPHAVMDESLPDGTPLGVDWALQDPQDYLDVLYKTLPDVIKKSGVDPADIIGIGTDFTACTWLPIKSDGTPLCFLPQYRNVPHAYVKLWKHHAAQYAATKINDLAVAQGAKWLARYGSKVSSEWQLPKTMQILDEAPEIFDAADMFIEAADWITWALCGVFSKNRACAGYKGMWAGADGYPDNDFLTALDPRLADFFDKKVNYPMVDEGVRVGGLTKEMAEKTGLRPGIAVCSGHIDAHVQLPACKITGPGQLLAIMGTSTCHIMMSETESFATGICGVTDGGVMQGSYGYEAGQSCVGDHFAWMVDNCCPESYHQAARAEGKNIHAYLTELAAKQKPGESGLVALDWWNGNRSILMDGDLTGMMLGMTLTTKPEEIYRALIEATAYGTRKIVDNYKANGIEVREFIASGGISQKNPMAMQIYCDVLNMPIKIAGANQAGSLGSAIYAAAAAGEAEGGYKDVPSAAAVMGKLRDEFYTPIPENVAIYEKLYKEYDQLHDYFGLQNDVMKRLKELKKQVRGE